MDCSVPIEFLLGSKCQRYYHEDNDTTSISRPKTPPELKVLSKQLREHWASAELSGETVAAAPTINRRAKPRMKKTIDVPRRREIAVEARQMEGETDRKLAIQLDRQKTRVKRDFYKKYAINMREVLQDQQVISKLTMAKAVPGTLNIDPSETFTPAVQYYDRRFSPTKIQQQHEEHALNKKLIEQERQDFQQKMRLKIQRDLVKKQVQTRPLDTRSQFLFSPETTAVRSAAVEKFQVNKPAHRVRGGGFRVVLER